MHGIVKSPPTPPISLESIRERLTGTDDRNMRAAQALMDVYENSDDGKKTVERFLSRARPNAQIRSQMIVQAYDALGKDPEKLKPHLARPGFAHFERYEDG